MTDLKAENERLRVELDQAIEARNAAWSRASDIKNTLGAIALIGAAFGIGWLLVQLGF